MGKNFYKGANTFLKGGGALHETQLSIVGLYKDIKYKVFVNLA